jgi:hypothetical protein
MFHWATCRAYTTGPEIFPEVVAVDLEEVGVARSRAGCP